MSSKKVLVYFGKRGGGIQLLIDTMKDLESRNCKFEVLGSDEAIEAISKVASSPYVKKSVFIPHSIHSLLIFNGLFRTIRSGLTLCRIGLVSSGTDFIHVMPSPFDRLLDLAGATARGNRIVRCIHDVNTHSGEWWPTKNAILRRINSADLVVFFSESERNKIKLDKTSFVCSLPQKFFVSESINDDFKETIESLLISEKPTIVIIGRIRDYKGLTILSQLDDNVLERFNILLAGEGKIPLALPNNVSSINRWLTDAEYLSIIEKFDLFLLPYTESTQSGLIPLLIHLNKIIMVSNTEGLLEQIQDYPNGTHFSLHSPQELNRVILNQLHRPEFDVNTIDSFNSRPGLKLADVLVET